MAILTIIHYGPGLTPSASLILPSNPTPATASSQAPGSIQPNTILGIVVGLVGFVTLVLACSFISRLPCFRQPQDVSPRLQPPWAYIDIRRELHNHNHHMNTPRPRPLIHHVDLPVVSMLPLRTHPYDHGTTYLPPYGGPSPPPYSEALRHPLQHPHPPPRAVVEV